MMFLHVGADVVVNLKRIVAILDLRTSTAGEATREFIQLANREKTVVDVAGGEPKSVVLTDSEMYLSPISSVTLMKRAGFFSRNASIKTGRVPSFLR